MNGPEWCTIESDPGVFTELIGKFGVKDVQVEELWGLDESAFKQLSPMYGLIFLFKWDQTLQTDIASNALDEVPEGVFFAKQTIHNACATQAILNILLNCSKQLQLGDTLTNFLEFTESLDPESIGIALGNQDKIRQAHNSFKAPEPIQIERAKDDDEGEAFHFISYVPINGILYEIDGLQKGPRLIDACDENDWFTKAKNILQQRMMSYQSKELRFTLLAICKDLKVKYSEEKKELMAEEETDEIKVKIDELDRLIKEEEIKKEKWRKENIRRRHNYFPFILNLIGMLGKQGLLRDLTEKAKEKKKEKIKRMEDEKKKREEAEKKEKDKGDTDKDKDKEKDKDNDTEMTDKSGDKNTEK